jgi:hypothetical protein
MQITFRKMVAASVLAVAALGAVTAHADVADPTTGNGELTLFVKNNVTGEVYARGLQINIDSIIAQGTGAGQTGDPSYTGPTTLSYSFAPIGADGTLTSFLSTGATGDFSWGILAGDSVGTTGSSSSPASPRRFVISTLANLDTGVAISNSGLSLEGTSQNSFFAALNVNLPDPAGSSVRGFGSAGGLWGATGSIGELAPTFFNQAPNQANGALGTDVLNFYVLSSGGTTNPSLARVYILNDVQLDANGTLHMVVSAAPVPLPAAVWLLGSGLLGLIGVGRRRRGTAAV